MPSQILKKMKSNNNAVRYFYRSNLGEFYTLLQNKVR